MFVKWGRFLINFSHFILSIQIFFVPLRQEINKKNMRTIKLTNKEEKAFGKIAKRSKMDCWFQPTAENEDGSAYYREIDINTLIDGATEYDVETLTTSEFLTIANVLIHCKNIK